MPTTICGHSFPGYDKPKKTEVIESGGIKSLLVNGKIYMSWASWDTESQRMVIVQLYKSKFATQQDLSRVFGIHVNSVQKYIADFTKAGLEGLITQRSGPRERWKITPHLRSKILILALKEGVLGHEAIQKRLEAWNERVSISGSIRTRSLQYICGWIIFCPLTGALFLSAYGVIGLLFKNE